MHLDYVPRRDDSYAAWLANIKDYVLAKTGETDPWSSFISAQDRTQLAEYANDMVEMIQKMKGPHTTADTTKKNELRKFSEKFVRSFVRKYLAPEAGTPVTDADRTAMNLPNRDKTKTPAPIPATGPDPYSLTSPEAPGVVRFRYRGARPKGCDRCEIRYTFADEPPANPDTFPSGDTFTHNPFMKTFGNDRGKKIFYAMRWLVSGGAVSPWSEIREVIVP